MMATTRPEQQQQEDEGHPHHDSSTVATEPAPPLDDVSLHQEGKTTTTWTALVNETPTMIPHGKRNSRILQPSKKEKQKRSTASWRETLAFVFDDGDADDDDTIIHASSHRRRRRKRSSRLRMIFAAGVVGAIINGLLYPAIAFLFAESLSTMAGVSTSSSLEPLKQVAFYFLLVGVVALIFGLLQGWCFEIVAHHGAKNFSRAWFEALLRQDAAFFGTFIVLCVCVFVCVLLFAGFVLYCA
jgi:ABC-type bacteriocin/lantibiotic exporter with double-glycine peptidase domain